MQTATTKEMFRRPSLVGSLPAVFQRSAHSWRSINVSKCHLLNLVASPAWHSLILPCGAILPLSGWIWNGKWWKVPAPPFSLTRSVRPALQGNSSLQMMGSFVPGTNKQANKYFLIPWRMLKENITSFIFFYYYSVFFYF